MSDNQNNLTCSFKKLKKIVNHLKRAGMTNSSEIHFEFLVGSCFPNVLENIKAEMMNQHSKGYAEGYEEGKNSNFKE